MPRQTELEKELHHAFNAGWRDFVKTVNAEVDRKNARMFWLLTLIKGPDFVRDLKGFLRASDLERALLRVTRQPVGIWLPDRRFATIPKFWIEGGPKNGSVYVQVKDERWLRINYHRD